MRGQAAPLVVVISIVFGCLLFVVLWAGINFAWGSALDGPVGAFIMQTPCQRLGRTREPLIRYTLGGGKSRTSGSVCHFASGALRVGDGQTEGLGFTGREAAYLASGFIGYGLSFVGAMALAVYGVRGARRLARWGH